MTAEPIRIQHTSSRLDGNGALAVDVEAQARAAFIREAKCMGEAATCTSLPLDRNMEYQRHRWATFVLRDVLRGEIAEPDELPGAERLLDFMALDGPDYSCDHIAGVNCCGDCVCETNLPRACDPDGPCVHWFDGPNRPCGCTRATGASREERDA